MALSAPVLTSAISSTGEVTLIWNPVLNATGYNILYGTASLTYSVTITAGNLTQYVVTGLINNITYYFVVQATAPSLVSANSNELSATVAASGTVVDFSQVMPPVFLQSPLLVTYINAINTLLGGVQTDIANLYTLVNPYTCPTQYLQNLANLVGLQLRTSSYLPANTQQTQLINVVAWYKIKGTYASIQYLALLLGLNINIRQFWCDNSTDYNNGVFVPENWFIDTTGSSYPADLTSSYFPTPHFGVYIDLNQLYTNTTNYVTNGNFISWLGGTNVAPTGWTNNGGGTVLQVTSPVYNSQFAVQYTGSQITLGQQIDLGLGTNYWIGRSITFGCWVWASTSYVNVNIYWGYNNFNASSAYHPGDSQWHYLTVTATVPLYASQVRPGLNISGSGNITAYFDGAVLTDNSPYLWNDTPYPDLFYFEEQTRPVHTVPHFILEVDTQANESGGMIENPGNIIGAVTNWSYTTNYYDTNLEFDNSVTYDNSYTAFLQSITQWAVGTGNINGTQPPIGIDTYTKLMLHLNDNTNNLTIDGGFTSYSSSFTYWTIQGASATATQSTAELFSNYTYSAKVTRSGTNATLVNSNNTTPTGGLSYWGGRTIQLGCWVWCATASCAVISLYDGTTSTNSPYHPGDSQWHYLTISATMKSSPTYVQFGMSVVTTNTSAYFDGITAYDITVTDSETQGTAKVTTPTNVSYNGSVYEFPFSSAYLGQGIDSYTQLMIHGYDTTDWSSNGFTVTNSNVTISPGSPPFGNGQYSGYYATFNGTSSYLSAPSNSAFTIGTGAFCWEAWINPTSISGTFDIIAQYQNSSNFIYLQQSNATLVFEAYIGGVMLAQYQTGNCLTAGTWQHIAIARNGSSFTIWVNGSQPSLTTYVAFTSGTNVTGITSAMYIGQNGNGLYYFSGSVAEVRLSYGTSRFGNSFIPMPWYYTNTSYLTVATSTDFNFTTNNFTWECWINPTSVNDGLTHVLLNQDDGVGNNYAFISYNNGIVNFVALSSDAYIANYYTTTSCLTAGTWQHVAIVRYGTQILIFVNGVSQTLTPTVAIGTSSLATLSSRPFEIGGFNGGSYAYSGFIQEVRISNGIARWTSNFTPSKFIYNSTLGNQVLTGSGVLLKTNTGSHTFIAKVPQSISQTGITEMMLLTSGGVPVFSATFPSILKTTNEELDFFVTINQQ